MSSTTQAPVAVPGSTAHTDGGWGVVPIQTRSERPQSYDPADFGAPTGREVNWKHTPIERLAPLWQTDAAATRTAGITVGEHVGVEVDSLAPGSAPRGEVFTPEDYPAALAWVRTPEATRIRLTSGVELSDPVVVDVVADTAATFTHLVIEAEPHARGTVLLRHAGPALLAQNVEIIVRDGAALTVVSVQRWDDDAVHAAAHQARVERDGALTHVVVSLGGSVVRVNPSVELAGPGSRAQLYGVSFSDSGQHLESQVYLHHKGPHTVGDVLYKGALQGESARSVWIGDVLIGRNAVGTDSYEANRNLVLTDGARADSIPNLEIETGDIAGAGHASATGRFDDEQLFYLQARGIPEAEARRLVVLGFLGEIVQRIGIPTLEDELMAAIERELEEGAAA
ncbi:Fe-S cluster assembly protein SufD [Microbacterium sp. AK009]|uniref:Fe-S cluster assembly protein SufD n=1 Tax=Microbacterium sp. AK009 TaxID=2723068 RepID=UPI0015C96698|nr:Fe-S cluster assembly protein SufD [Microbacterium sp. AK009]NYF16242.1 Fe-S cluster assembly protein SufD [Microbacterium sp. AK009]